MAEITSADIYDGEPDRANVIANGIVVDVIANDDGSVYVECYAYQPRVEGAPQTRRQVVVSEAFIDAYTVYHPNFRLTTALVNRP